MILLTCLSGCEVPGISRGLEDLGLVDASLPPEVISFDLMVPPHFDATSSITDRSLASSSNDMAQPRATILSSKSAVTSGDASADT